MLPRVSQGPKSRMRMDGASETSGWDRRARTASEILRTRNELASVLFHITLPPLRRARSCPGR
ncbi:hypothetical protein BD413DRAFT_84066 [Trametes elegans]|nr:hypothetical protein BD413DRAFT_84066 [Trametes elegans]